MLAVFLLIFAGFATIGTLAIIAAPKITGGYKAFLTIYNAFLIVVMVLSAIQLMG